MKKLYTEIDFDSLADLTHDELATQALHLGLKNHAMWLLPQLTAHIAEDWTLHKDDDGLLDPRMFLSKNVPKSNKFRVGIWKYLNRISRSEILPVPQTKMVEYCLLVPIIMMAFKRFQNIPYSRWTAKGIDLINQPLLGDVMLHGDIVLDDPIELRDQILMYKSGPKVGQRSNPISTWAPRSVKNTPLQDKPQLTGTLALQLWCAHPTLRTPYMILDPSDWDNMPPPLFTDEVFKAPPTVTKKPKIDLDELPW